MSWALFGQICGLMFLAWMLIGTLHSNILDKRRADDIQRKQAGVYHRGE